ncbi:hypothetical protein CROQUDRAFT_71450 [Cronartium quercuum f. sp. fusiforme G11]|uniref:Small-subunit processome Utp12 domain-containing protein n=1 Tax=Cronartium quercuum f. sp. fusiforme G11 TaxID=708437 RepID=A0A9P6TGR0_9BASI|nr:hypothetical protein CROQUDRAFT_71450 [Cronartium quercuum f. sp. fusiforme G11]
MVTLTNGVTPKRPRTQKTTEEDTNNDRMEDSEASSSHESDKEETHQEPAQESFADRLKILNINEADPPKPNGIRVPVNSLAQTLVQALNSADSKLLETCLFQTKKSLMPNTLRRIPKPLVHTLIEQLIISLNKKKRGAGEGATVATVRRTKTLIEWVRQLLLIHMSYLITIPALVTKLTTLHSSLQKRLVLHSKLLSLNGRLELVLNQIEQNKSSGPAKFPTIAISNPKQPLPESRPTRRFKDPKAVKTRAPVKYVEGESTDEDEETAKASKSQEESEGSEDEDEASEDEGSIEDVVLGSESDSDTSDGSSEADLPLPKSAKKNKLQVSEELFDLEAELSGSDEDEDYDDDDDDEYDEDEDDEDDDDMADFIDDGVDDDSEDDDESD